MWMLREVLITGTRNCAQAQHKLILTLHRTTISMRVMYVSIWIVPKILMISIQILCSPQPYKIPLNN